MWKYQCKKQLLVLVLMFIAGAVLFGALGYGKEYIQDMVIQVTGEKDMVLAPYVLYIAGGIGLAGIANGLMLLMYIIQRYRAPYLFFLIFFISGVYDIVVMVGMLLLLPTVVICLYGWLTIPNRGSGKALRKNNVSTIQEVERVYRLHHTYDESYDEMAKKAAGLMWKTNFLIALGLASIFLVFVYVESLSIVLLCVFLYMMLFYEISRRRNRALQPFIALLYEQCNPQACASAIFALSKRLRYKKKFILAQHLAQCMIYLNDPHLAVDILVTCDQSKGNMVYAYQSLMAYAYYLLGDRSMVKHAYEECEKYGAKNAKGPMMQLRQQSLEGIQTRLDMMDKNFDRALLYFQKGLETLQFEFQRVEYHYYAGLICYVQNDRYEARSHFEYVTTHGNQFYIVEKAESFLKGMDENDV